MPGAAADCFRNADGAVELSAAGSGGTGYDAAGGRSGKIWAAAACGDGIAESAALSRRRWPFSLPGEWTAIDPSTVDYAADTGELTLPWNLLGLPYNEVMVTYTAGLAAIGDDVKSA